MATLFGKFSCSVLLVLVTISQLCGTSAAADIPGVDVLEPSSLLDSAGNTVDANDNIVFAPLQPDTSGYMAKTTGELASISGFYDFSQSFVESTMSGEYPYDLIASALDGEFQTTDWQEMATTYMAYVIGFAVGVILLIVLPIAGCCFCCCRRAGKCGGRRVIYKAEDGGYGASCGRYTSMLLLFLSTAVAIAGSALMLQANENVSVTVDFMTDGELDKIDDVPTFLDNLISDARSSIVGRYNFTVEVLRRDLNNVGYLVGQPMEATISSLPDLTSTNDAALELETNANTVLQLLSELDNSEIDVNTKIDDVMTDYKSSTFKTNLDLANNNYPSFKTSIGTDFANKMNNYASGSIQFPNLGSEITNLQLSMSGGISGILEESQTKIAEIPERVQNGTVDDREDVISELSKYYSDVEKALKDLESLKDDVMDGVNFDDLKDSSTDGMETVSEYEQYRWTAGLVLGILSVLIEALLIWSVLYGFCGGDAKVNPTDRTNMSDCAGKLLFISVILIVSVGWFLMLFTLILFTVGAPLDAFVCEPVRDLTILDKLLDEYGIFGGTNDDESWLGDRVFPDQGVDLTISQLMKDCQQNKAIYTTLKLNETDLVDLDDLLNYQEAFNISDELRKLEIDFDSISLDTTDLNTFLDDFKRLISKIDINDYETALDGNPAALINEFEIALQAYIAPLSAGSEKDAMELLLADFNTFTAGTSMQALQTELADINSDLTEMNKILTGPPLLEDQCDDLKSDVDALNSDLPGHVEDAFDEAIEDFGDRFSKVLDQFVNNIEVTITQELGQCVPLWNVYDDLLVEDVCTYFIGSLTSWWCAMGMTIIFLVVAAITSCSLSKHLYRMDLPHDLPSPTVTPRYAQNGYSRSALFNNKVYHADNMPSAPFPDSNGGAF